MPKPNVDEVTLLAIREMTTAGPGLAANWWVPVGDPSLSTTLGYKATINTIGTIISEQIGAGINTPDRVYQIGVDMPSGANVVLDGDGLPTIIEDPAIDGLDYSLHVRGVELLIKGDEWQNDVIGGGFRSTNGLLFEDGMIITAQFKPEISNVIVSPDSVARFTIGVQVVTGSVTAGDSFNRKLIVMQGAAAAAPTYTLNPTYPENVLFEIITGGGLNRQTIVTPPGGQTMFAGGAVSRVVLGTADYMKAVRIGTVWYVVDRGDRWKCVGENADGGIAGPDTLVANRQSVLIADWPGLDDYLNALEVSLPGSVVTIGSAPANLTRWARGGGQILLPDLRGLAKRNLSLGATPDPDPDRVSGSIWGSFQSWAMYIHRHLLFKRKNVTFGNTFPPLPTATQSAVSHTTKTTSTGAEAYYIVGDVDEPDVVHSGGPVKDDSTTIPAANLSAVETRSSNYGVVPLIRV